MDVISEDIHGESWLSEGQAHFGGFERSLSRDILDSRSLGNRPLDSGLHGRRHEYRMNVDSCELDDP